MTTMEVLIVLPFALILWAIALFMLASVIFRVLEELVDIIKEYKRKKRGN